MAYEFRRPVDEFFGSLRTGVTALDTSISADVFTGLPTDLSTSVYLPLVLADDSVPVYEVVYATAHGSGTNSLSIIRGQEGTSARQWPAGTVVRCAPTARDGIQGLTNTAITGLLNPHTGTRVVSTNDGLEKGRTASQGFLPYARFLPGSIKQGVSNDYMPASSQAPLIFAGHSIMATQNNNLGVGGHIYLDFGTGNVLNSFISIVVTKFAGGSDTRFGGAPAVSHVETSPGNWRVWIGCTGLNNALLANGITCNVSVLAIGV